MGGLYSHPAHINDASELVHSTMPTSTVRGARKAMRDQAKSGTTTGRGVGGRGRPKGSANKRTVEVQLQLQALECDPILFLAMTMMNKTSKLKMKKGEQVPFKYRLEAAKELAHYIAPKRKAIDITSDDMSLEETFAAAVEKLNRGK